MSVVALGRIRASHAPGWAVAVQLARREGVRLVRHPIFVVGALLSFAMFGLLTWHMAPVFHRDDISMAGAVLPLAVATLLVANLAASRSARNSTDELYDGTATTPWARTMGHLLSLVVPMLASLGIIGVMFVYALLDSPVGIPRIAELLVGPVDVVLLGAMGIAIGRWKAHPAMGPLSVVGVVAVETLLIQPVISGQGMLRQVPLRTGEWFAFWVPMGLTGEVPPELVIRPSWWHLLFLVGVAILFAAIALARAERGRRLVPFLGAGVIAIVGGTVGQFIPPTDAQRASLVAMIEHPEDHQTCEERTGVTYCAYPAYAPWIDRWAAPVEGALAAIPPEERPQGLVIRQTFGTYFEGPTDVPGDAMRRIERAHNRLTRRGTTDPVINTPVHWGRWSREGMYAIGLSLSVAMEALDFPSSRSQMVLNEGSVAYLKETMIPTVPKQYRAKAERRLVPGRRWSSCHTVGQARSLAAWWVAGQATMSARATVIDTSQESPFGLQTYEVEGQKRASYIGPFLPLYPLVRPRMWDRVNLGDAEFHHGAELLQRPDDDVARVINENWSLFEDPATTTAAVLDRFDLEAHPTIDEQIAALPDDVKLDPGNNADPYVYLGGTIPCP